MIENILEAYFGYAEETPQSDPGYRFAVLEPA
jgi:hypothetical protein